MPSLLQPLVDRLLRLYRPEPADTAFDAEIQQHLELLTERYAAQGMTREQAVSAARRQFGNVTLLREQRDPWAMRALACWWLDLKLGWRMLVKYPGLALVGGFGIAVAIAIATGGFSVIHGSYLSSLPVEEGDRMVSLEIWDTAANAPELRSGYEFHTWREELKSIVDLSAFRTSMPNLIAPGAQPQDVRVASITASGFRAARVRPLIGRHLTEDDERPGAPAVVVIAEHVWRSRFASDSAILGKTIQLGPTAHSIVGVMPPGFAFPVNHSFWIPLRSGPAPATPMTGTDLRVFGRLAPSATLESAQTELAALTSRIAIAFPQAYARLRPQVMPYTSPYMGLHSRQDVTGLLTADGAMTSLLVLVCLNVAILVYTRTAMRQAEIATRTALGASRARIVAQLFFEALVLAAAGTVTGVVTAAFALRQLTGATRHIAADLPFWLSFHLSPEAVFYAAVLALLAAAIVGILPALRATRHGLQAATRIAGTNGSGMGLGKTWTALIVAQVGIAVALLPASVFHAWEQIRAAVAGPGFAASEFLCGRLSMDDPSGPATPSTHSAARQSEWMRRLEADSRVAGVTLAMFIPGGERPISIETDDFISHEVRFNRVDTNFFRTFEVPILAGRGLESADARSADRPGGAGVVVNQSFAQAVFRGDALGRRIRYAQRGTAAAAEQAASRWYEIVGIVSDFPTGARPDMYETQARLYHAASPGELQPAAFAVRVRGASPSAFGPRLRETATALDPALQLFGVRSLEAALRSEQWINRLQAAVLSAVSLSVVLLSAAGIYALMSFTVSQRRKEIGIRIALGADRKRIIAGIFARALRQLAFGAALGAAAAALLEQRSGGDLLRGNAPTVLPAVALFMMGVGFLAALGPARRSLRVEPTQALREQ